jgi:hypothetical protein
LSQEDLAEITGISVRGIRNLEADPVTAPPKSSCDATRTSTRCSSPAT